VITSVVRLDLPEPTAFFGQGISHDVGIRIMDRAWDLGIRAFDTADAYGGGRSGRWIGEWPGTKRLPNSSSSYSARRTRVLAT